MIQKMSEMKHGCYKKAAEILRHICMGYVDNATLKETRPKKGEGLCKNARRKFMSPP